MAIAPPDPKTIPPKLVRRAKPRDARIALVVDNRSHLLAKMLAKRPIAVMAVPHFRVAGPQVFAEVRRE